MEKTQDLSSHILKEEDAENLSSECRQVLSTLAKKRVADGRHFYQYQGFWFDARVVEAIIAIHRHFQAQDNDVIVITSPKSGTTWVKALAFAIVNRNRHPLNQIPLLTANPHDLVPFLELNLYWNKNNDQYPNLQAIESPRLFSSHLPYQLLPASIKDSGCKIVYLCRHQLDRFASFLHFLNRNRSEAVEPTLTEERFEMFYEGFEAFGPFWDHVLAYWKLSLERPEKVLFLKFEDLKEDPISHIKALAQFLGFPFSEEEERAGVVEEISSLCSLESLKNMEVNVRGGQSIGIKNSSFFRKGEVGGWVNLITPSMAERMEALLEEKFRGSGLSFKSSPSRISKEDP